MKTFISLDITHLPAIGEALREYIKVHQGNTHNSVPEAKEALKFINEAPRVAYYSLKMDKFDPKVFE